MSLQVCGRSPGPSATGTWEAGRQGKALPEESRPVLSSTCRVGVEQQGSLGSEALFLPECTTPLCAHAP